MNRILLPVFLALAAIASAQVTVPWEDVTKPVAISSVGALTPAANRIPYYVDPMTAGLIAVGGNLSLSGGTLNLSATPNIGAASGSSLNLSGNLTANGTQHELKSILRVTDASGNQHLLIGNQDGGGANKPSMIRAAMAQLGSGMAALGLAMAVRSPRSPLSRTSPV